MTQKIMVQLGPYQGREPWAANNHLFTTGRWLPMPLALFLLFFILMHACRDVTHAVSAESV